MNSKQLGLSEYNDIIRSIYDSNPVAGMSDAAKEDPAEGAEPQPKTKLVPTGLLYKETLRLRNTAVLNVKLSEMIFRYEKRRFKELIADYRGLVAPRRKKATDTQKEEKEEKKEKKDEDRSIFDYLAKGFKHLKRLLGNAIKRGIKRLVGKRGIKLVRKGRRLIRVAKYLKKKFIRRLGRPFRQTRRFAQKLGRMAVSGVKGAVRKGFFKGVRGVKGALSTARQVKDIVGTGIQLAKGGSVATKAAKSPGLMTKIGKGLGGAGAKVANAGKVALGAGKKLLGKAVKPLSGALAKKGLAKVGAKGLGKAVAKKIPGLSIIAGIGFGIERALKGDGIGALGEIASGIAGTVPGAGTAVSLAIDGALIGRDLAKEGLAEGGEVEKPQLVLVGEGGEKEWIVPKSKLAAFLGAPGALGLLTFGASHLYSAVSEHLRATGTESEAQSAIPELSKLKTLPKENVGKSTSGQFKKVDVGNKIFDTVLNGFKNILGGIMDKIKAAKEAVGKAFNWFKNNAAGAAAGGLGLFANMLTPPAAAGTMPENAEFGRVSGQSGSVKYAGKSGASLSTNYSPFASTDIKSKGISIISGKGERFGRQHRGYDLAAPSGTPIYAYLPGKVTKVDFDSGGYGNYIEWQDSVYKQKHLFAHMVAPSPLKNGQTFEQGAILGNVGSTGVSEGPHLHWEIGAKGSEVDPGQWVNSHPLPDDKKINPKPKVSLNNGVGPEPQPALGNLLPSLTPTPQQPQLIPVPVPMGNGLTLGGGTSYYGAWGHNILGN